MMDTMKRIAAALLSLVVIVVLVGCDQSAGDQNTADGQTVGATEIPRNVRVLTVERSDLEEFLEISGPVKPVRGADVSAEEGGRVELVPHDRGDQVRKGDVLVELDRRLLAAEIEAARAAVEQQDHNARMTRELHTEGKVSRQEMLNVDAMAAQARAILEAARIRYERAAIPAPFDGLVADRYVEPGELVAPGAMVTRVIDPYVLKIEGSVTERDVAWIREGASARVQLAGSAETVAGRVHWVGFEADSATGKFKVEIRIANPDLLLRSGIVGRASIHRRTIDAVVTVPRDAVLTTGSGAAVYVVEDGRATLKHIVLGSDQGLMVAVSSGLDVGEELVVRGHRDLVEHALVTITERSTRRDGGVDGDPGAVAEASTAPRSGQEASR